MTIIMLETKDQELNAVEQPVIASGDVNSVEVRVQFDYTWDDYGKSAVFFTSKDDTVYEAVLTYDKCVVPHEVLKEQGMLFIGIRGVNSSNGAIKTSALLRYKISEGAPRGEATTVDPTPDVYQQLLTAYRETEDALAVERARIDDLEQGTEEIDLSPYATKEYVEDKFHIEDEVPTDWKHGDLWLKPKW